MTRFNESLSMKNIIPTYAIIVASGTGSRSGLDIPKQFFKIDGETILNRCINIFAYHQYIKGVVIVCAKAYIEEVKTSLESTKFNIPVNVIIGGVSRQESVFLGIKALYDLNHQENVNVLIHDGVRPFLSVDIINKCVNALSNHNAITVAIPSNDTILDVDNSTNMVRAINDRSIYRRCQTPQGFDLSLIKKVHEDAISCDDYNVSDDCGLILKYSNEKIYVVEGSDINIKITTPTDIVLAKSLWNISQDKNDKLE